MSKVETTLTTFDSWFGSKKALSIIVNMRRGMMFERDIAKAAWEAASSENEALRAKLEEVKKERDDLAKLLHVMREALEAYVEANSRDFIQQAEAMSLACKALVTPDTSGLVVSDGTVTPEMLKEAQTNTEIGAYICSNWFGAYECLTDLFVKMLRAKKA